MTKWWSVLPIIIIGCYLQITQPDPVKTLTYGYYDYLHSTVEVNQVDNIVLVNIDEESIKQEENEVYSESNFSVPLKEARENFEKDYLTTQLKKFGGNVSKTAKFVGMERSALHRKLKDLGVKDLN